MKLQNYQEELELPQGVAARLENGELTLKGTNGEIKRRFDTRKIALAVEGSRIVFTAPVLRKNDKRLLGTYLSHVRNMIAGTLKNFVYKLKICSGHFPMNVTVTQSELVVKNFIGEKKPRNLQIAKGVRVGISGDVITVESNDLELAGLTAGAIEQLVNRPGFDKRVFQQGIYITDKPQ